MSWKLNTQATNNNSINSQNDRISSEWKEKEIELKDVWEQEWNDQNFPKE